VRVYRCKPNIFNISSEPVSLFFFVLRWQWLGSREESPSCPEHGSAPCGPKRNNTL
jgi:hypothetical protein